MRMTTSLWVTLVLAPILPGALVTTTCTPSGANPTISLASPDVTTSVECGQFNPTLGTLTAAGFQLGSLLISNASLTIRNDGASATSGTIFGASVSGVFGAFPDGGSTGPVNTPITTTAIIGAGQTSTIAISAASGFGVSRNITTNLSGYLGTGTFILPVSITSQTLPQSGLTILDYSGTVQYSMGPTIFYTYTPVPEPDAALTLTVALSWLIQRRRVLRSSR